MEKKLKSIEIYTDGACSGNPGIGGWGAVLIFNGKIKEIFGSELNTTNNQMELLAVIKALELVKEKCEIKLFSDSAYVINAFTQNWVENWQANNWKNSQKKDVKNRELWEKIIQFDNFHQIKWIKVKGHADNEFNNRCDTLATTAIDKLRESIEVPV